MAHVATKSNKSLHEMKLNYYNIYLNIIPKRIVNSNGKVDKKNYLNFCK